MKNTSNKRAGFTVLELMISVTVLSIVVSGVVMATRAGAGTFKTNMANGDVETKGRRVIERLTRELASAKITNPAPLFLINGGADTLDFQMPTGFTGGAMTWGPTMRLALELEDGELDNGVDDNNNGLIDEGRLVRITDPFGESTRVVLAHGIPELLEGEETAAGDDNGNGGEEEPGVWFVLDPDLRRLNVSISIQGVDADGRLIVRTTETVIGLRN